MPRRIHIAAAALASALVLSFWASSSLTLRWWPEAHPAARLWILGAIPLLIASVATAGVTGRRLAHARGNDPRIIVKKALTAGLAANGLLVLTPCAIWLREGVVPGTVAAVEDVGGILQLAMLAALSWTGRSLRHRRTSRATHAPAERATPLQDATRTAP